MNFTLWSSGFPIPAVGSQTKKISDVRLPFTENKKNIHMYIHTSYLGVEGVLQQEDKLI